MGSTAKDLFNAELRLRQLLAPYAGKLEEATIYGIPCLRKPGAGAQEWFAFIKVETKFISLYLLPIYTSADLRRSMSPALAKRLTGKATFHFKELDDAMAAEVEGLLARAFDIYMAEPEDEADAAAEPKPQAEAEAEAPAEPDAPAEPEAAAEPEATAEPEAAAEAARS